MTTATKEEPKAAKNGMDSVAAALSPTKKPEAATTETKPKEPDVPKEIKTNEDLIKAIYSSRNNLYCPVVGVDFPIAIVKSDLTTALKELDPAGATPYDLVKRSDGKGATLVVKKKA